MAKISPAVLVMNGVMKVPIGKGQADAPIPSPVDVLSALRDRPMVCRVPMVIAKVAAAANSTSQTASGLREAKEGGVSVMVRSGIQFSGGQQGQGLLNQRMQGLHPL